MDSSWTWQKPLLRLDTLLLDSLLLPHSCCVSCETWMRLGETSGRENARCLSQALQALPERSCPAPCSIADLVDFVRDSSPWEEKNQS